MISASSSTAHWATGKSWLRIASTVSDATPGQANTVSVTTAPPRSWPNWRPRMVMTGMQALRKRVLGDDQPLADPLGAGGLDVVHVHDLDHARAHEAHGDRGQEGAETERRHHEVLPGAVPGGRQGPQPDREQDDEHDAEPEQRHRLAGDRQHRAEVVDERVAPERGEDAEGQGDEERRREAGEGEVDRRGHSLEHQAERRLCPRTRTSRSRPGPHGWRSPSTGPRPAGRGRGASGGARTPPSPR